MKKQKKDTKSNVLPHTKAKHEIYKEYLSRYLPVIFRAKFFHKIDIWDVFSGPGIYDDGNIGSPIIALEEIREAKARYNERPPKVTLYLNDIDQVKVLNLKTAIDSRNNPEVCDVRITNLQYQDLIKLCKQKIEATSIRLIFIDPYGYKEIKMNDIKDLLDGSKSEILLFLPISNMYRFLKLAEENPESKFYSHLNNFVQEFTNKFDYESQLDFIDCIKAGLSCNGKYYTAKYHIERTSGNYYAIFFLGAHIYGLYKFVEAIWSLDKIEGAGFNQPTMQRSLFETQEKIDSKRKKFSALENAIIEQLKKNKLNNRQMLELALNNGFMPSHANEIIKSLAERIRVVDLETGEKARSNYITWDNYNKPARCEFILLK